jgi:peroxiredoxin
MTRCVFFVCSRLVVPGLLAVLTLSCLSGVSRGDEMPISQASFSGSLVQPGEGDGEILRRFEVELFHEGTGHFFLVNDDVRAGCPWPDCFGLTGPSVPADRVQPHLVYPFDGTVYLLGLPPLMVSLPSDIEPGATWEQAGWQMTAVEPQSLDNAPAWIIEARERRGRQQTLTIDAATGTLLRGEADVFMGQGDQFRLTIARTASKPLPLESAAAMPELQSQLLTLQTALKRRPDAHGSELSQRQVEDVMSGIAQLTRLATGTPLEDLVRRIRVDAEQQQKRLASAASRANELMNSPAPDFSLTLVGGGKLDASALKGKTVVLHFWDYRDAPLSEPYGQTGYLEFVFSQKKKMNVEVVGVSTNPDLQTPENLGRGRRSARKLSEFMNLTYPIGHDDGALLEAFGDPRDAKGQLPLWIVLNSDGKVVHYHAGFYEVDAAQGLKELEAILSGLLKDAAKK